MVIQTVYCLCYVLYFHTTYVLYYPAQVLLLGFASAQVAGAWRDPPSARGRGLQLSWCSLLPTRSSRNTGDRKIQLIMIYNNFDYQTYYSLLLLVVVLICCPYHCCSQLGSPGGSTVSPPLPMSADLIYLPGDSYVAPFWVV